MKKLFKEKYLELSVNEKDKCLLMEWKGYFSSEDYRKGLNATEDIVGNYSLDVIIVDALEAGVVGSEDTDWTTDEIVPELINFGVKRIYFVIPKSVLTQMTVKNLELETKTNLEIKYFKSRDEALAEI